MKKNTIKFFGFLALVVSIASCGGNVTSSPEPTSTNPSVSEPDVSLPDSVDTHVHDFGGEWKYDVTNHWHECECEEKGDLAAHSYVETITKPATHVLKGEKKFECECGYSYEEEIPMIAHVFTTKWDDDNHWEECDCGDIRDVAAHSFTSSVSKQPTCEEVGTKTFACECGYYYTEDIPMIAHDHSDEWEVDATHHWHECECGDVVDKDEHNFVNGFCEVCEKQGLASGIAITPDTLTLTVGDSQTLSVTVTPEGLQGLVTIEYSTSDARVVTVNQDGLVTAIKDGVATITAKIKDGSDKTDSVVITVLKDYTSLKDVITEGEASDEFNVIGRVVAIYGNKYQGIYIANGDYGIQLHKTPNELSAGVEIGDLVDVTGTYVWAASNRSTRLDISLGTIDVITTVPEGVEFTEPVDYVFDKTTWGTITTSTVPADNVYVNRPLVLTGVVSVVDNGTQISMVVDGLTVIVYHGYENNLDEDIFEAFQDLKVGDEVTIRGAVGSYNGVTQLVAPQMPTLVPEAEHVAKLTIGTNVTLFDTLAEAFAAVPADGVLATIRLAKDFVGDGIELKTVGEGERNIVLDLNGKTYTINENLVGSTGTETNGLRFEPGNTVTIKNGTVDCTENNPKLAILVQKYNDLTLEDVTIDSSKAAHRNAAGTTSWNYAVSSNNGTIILKGDTHLISTGGVTRTEEGVKIYGGVAFDLCSFQSYAGVRFVIDASFTGGFVGGIEYSYDLSSNAALEDWYKTILFVKGGKEYTVKNVDAMAKGDMKEYVNYEAFLEDIKLLVDEEPLPAVPTTVSKAMKDYGWANATANGPFTLDSIVSVSYDGGANTGKYYDSGAGLRIYGVEKGTLTITVPEGYEVQSVTLTYTYDDGKERTQIDCESGVANVQPGGTTEVTFTTTGSAGHVRVSAISVTYVAVA